MRLTAYSHTRPKRRQQGYAILFVLFLLTLLVLTTAAVAPNVLTEGRREREKEMIWRGHQYVRGIKLYYRKIGKFPTSLDDLTKPKLGSIRFMRQAYKDPMNAADGQWRMIYVGPAGQLIGSLKPQRALQLSSFGGTQAVPAPNLTPNLGGMGGPGAIGSQPFGAGVGGMGGLGQPGQIGGGGLSTFGNNPGAPNGAPGINQPGINQSNGTGQPGTQDPALDTPDADAANEALLNSDPPVVMGGNIIGVGSKINHGSVIVYDQAKNYRQFEFIWDPSKDPLTIGGSATPQNGVRPGTPPNASAPFGPAGPGTLTPAQPGTQPGTLQNQPSPNAPLEPQPMPPETSPNPPPQS
jgi:hypothetical protein